MSRHPIDEIFKQRLSRRRESVPLGLWEEIAARRENARRKRRVLRWMYGGGGLLLVALLSIGYYYGTGSSIDRRTEEQPVLTPAAAGESPASAAPSLAPVPAPAPAESITEPGAAAAARVAAEAPSLRNAADRARRNRRREQSTDPASVATGTTEETSVQSWLLRSRSQSEPPAKKTTTPSKAGATPVAPAETDLPAQRQPDYTPHTQDEPGVSGPHRRSTRQSASVQTLTPREIRPTTEAEPRSRRVANLRCYDISRKRMRFEAEWLAGPTLGRQVLSARLDEARGHLLDRRSTETARPGFGGGLRFSMVSPRGFAVRSGLYYTELRNRFEFALPGESTTVITERYDPAGNVIGVDTSFSTEKIMYATTNRLRMLELPLLAGYEFQWNRLRVALTAGGHFNLWFDAQGQLLSPNSGAATDFGQVGDSNVFPIYTRQAGVGLYAGAALLYHLGGRYSLLVEPFLKSYPRSLTRSEYVLRENYWMGGLQVGLRARL